jgi:hypothetical protein
VVSRDIFSENQAKEDSWESWESKWDKFMEDNQQGESNDASDGRWNDSSDDDAEDRPLWGAADANAGWGSAASKEDEEELEKLFHQQRKQNKEQQREWQQRQKEGFEEFFKQKKNAEETNRRYENRQQEGKARQQQQRQQQQKERQKQRQKQQQKEQQKRPQKDSSQHGWASKFVSFVPYDKAWKEFETNGKVSICYDDIPWPPTAGTISGVSSSSGSGAKKLLRAALIRWHPDKFAKILKRVHEADRARTLEAVKAITRSILDEKARYGC